MKKVLVITAMSLTAATNVYADHHQSIGGLVLGAGGGALVGQAIGRNTESTVIGTAVGGVIGYIIGSEMDNSHRYARRVYHHNQPVIHKQRQVIQHNYYYEPVAHPPRGTHRHFAPYGSKHGYHKKHYKQRWARRRF
jgi:uncharacterized protein YcfJ